VESIASELILFMTFVPARVRPKAIVQLQPMYKIILTVTLVA